jgi:hypothetical protein
MLHVTVIATIREVGDKMNFVNTIAPIPIDELKKYFTDNNTFYIIDYKNSKLKGKKLLTYFSNLEIPVDISFKDTEIDDYFELLKEYFQTEMICNIKSLEKSAIDCLLHFKKIKINNFFDKFCIENELLIKEWVKKLDSLTLFNLYSVGSEEFSNFAQSYPSNDTCSLEGINFVSLLKHEEMYELYDIIEKDNLIFYGEYFNKYMFKGKNLFHFWANENNPLFLLTFGIAEGHVNAENYNEAKKITIQEFKDVSSVQ